MAEISIYSGKLTDTCIAVECKKLQAAFPNLSPMFFNLIGERITANKFTDDRLKAAIGYLLDNFRYPTPTIADVISYDKRVKLYSYSDVVEFVTEKGKQFKDFAKLKKNGKLFYIKASDKEMFNIPDELL